MRRKQGLPTAGMKLLECVLAMVLAGIILAPTSMMLQSSLASWQRASEEGDLLNHARLAMSRMTADLRYGVTLVQAGNPSGNSYLEFTTRNLENNDGDVETIKYWRMNNSPVLYRQVDGNPLPGYVVAGMEAPGRIVVDSFGVFPMVKRAGENYLHGVATGAGETLDMANAVLLTLIVKDTVTNKSLYLSSLAQLRNW